MQRIICGDNLEVLKKIPSESVDLCYIDPPFFSGRKYSVIFGDDEELRQFDDRWVKMAEKGKYSKDINVYLNWMEPRIKEIHRILKKTGSFYLHADYHADSYLRILCDGIFGYNKLQNTIRWHYGGRGAKGRGSRLSKNHDSIFFYKKGSKTTWNRPLVKKYIKTFSRDFRGAYYTSPRGDYTDTSIKRLEKEGRVHITSGGKVRIKYYLEEDTNGVYKMFPMDDVWSDLPDMMHVNKKERLGYPTQKPEALLKRIIKASSDEGDVVLDCFCGCGTTLAVADKLKRNFIGIDVSPTACRVMADRLDWTHNMIEGMALTSEEIGKLDGWEFQNWINREFGAVNGKRGADGGIDGDYNGVPIQVKKYRAGRPDLDNFSGVLLREGKKEGIYIAISYTSTFIKEVNRLDRDNGIIIHYFTPEDILAKKHESLLFEIDNV